MRILISAAIIISDYKIKMKNDEALTEALIKTFNKILDENYIILDDFSNKIEVD